MKIDIKSALCGLVIGAAVVLCIAAETSPNPVGRYQAVTGVTAHGGYALLVDTATGKVWGRIEDYKGDANFYDAKKLN